MALESKYTILAVDDARDTLMLLEHDLTAYNYHVVSALSGEEALQQMAEQQVDLVLLDIYMPNMSGLETLERIRSNEQYNNIPVIMLSASDDEDKIVHALDLGASDYVTKPYITKVLLARIRTALRLQEKNTKLEMMAKTDYLTGISNRKSFYELANKVITQSDRSYSYPIALASFDIDLFKSVNDTYGHDAGDLVLQRFASILQTSFRDYDIVARIGGEEFSVCMPNIYLPEAIAACERFREAVASYQFPINTEHSQFVQITTSGGLSSNQDKNYSLAELLKIADEGLYQAKQSGRNQVINNSGVNIISLEDEEFPGIDLEVGLKNVLNDKELFVEIMEMFYQDHQNDINKLRTAILNEDTATAKHVAHTLKGVASSVGAMNLFHYAKLLDSAITERKAQADLMTLFDSVAIELNIILHGIKMKQPDE